MKRKKGYFSISAVAKMFSVHQQTIRLYEKQGLISPKRSEGNTRLFAEEDVDRLEEVIYLTHQLGINLAGVEMILKLKKQISKMQNDMNKLFEQAQNQLEKDVQSSQETAKTAAYKLVRLKNTAPSALPADTTLTSITSEGETQNNESIDNDPWYIEYDSEK